MKYIGRAASFFSLVGRDGVCRLAQRWIERRYLRRYPELLRQQEEQLAAVSLRSEPLLSIVMPVHKPILAEVSAAIESVRSQSYQAWELCIVDDDSRDPKLYRLLEGVSRADGRVKVRIRESHGHISLTSNDAVSIARGEFLLFLDQDDLLDPAALKSIVSVIEARPGAALLYADEDKIDSRGRFSEPYLKPDFDPVLLRYQNAICHPMVVRRTVFESVGGFRTGVEGAQDWDLALRVVEQTGPEAVVHVPRILYHWRKGASSTASSLRAKSYVVRAQQHVITDHCARIGMPAHVEVVSSRVPLRVRRSDSGACDVVVIGSGVPPKLEHPRLRERIHVPRVGGIRGLALSGRDVLVLASGCSPRSAADIERLLEGLVHPEIDMVCGVIESPRKRILSAGFFADHEHAVRDLHEGASSYSDGHGNSLIVPHEVASPHAAAVLFRGRSWVGVCELVRDEDTPREWICRVSSSGVRGIVVPESRFVNRGGEKELEPFLASRSVNSRLTLATGRQLNPNRSQHPPQLGIRVDDGL